MLRWAFNIVAGPSLVPAAAMGLGVRSYPVGSILMIGDISTGSTLI